MTASRTWIALAAIALMAVLAARILGPSDTWDQTQPRTISYTIDVLANGGEHWILPREPGGHGATKPPLYTWLAAPFVAIGGDRSDLAHKMPSVLALMALWLMIVVVGNRLDAPRRVLGSVAAIMAVASYPLFKLGYLARPDMVLVLCLDVGWLLGTLAVTGASVRRGAVIGFWVAATAAAMAKGPAVLALLVAMPFVARTCGGAWRRVWRLRVGIGLPLLLAVVGGWLVWTWTIDAAHVRDEFWFNEIYGRITGVGPEGSHRGPIDLLMGMLHMPFYAVVRFLPWSILAITAWTRLRRETASDERILLLRSAVVFCVVTVVLFSLSAGKRADYVAPIYAPAAILAAWGLLRWRWTPSVAIATLAAAAIGITAMVVTAAREASAPARGWGDGLKEICRAASAAHDAHGGQLVLVGWGGTHVPVLLGGGQDLVVRRGALRAAIGNASTSILVEGLAGDDAAYTGEGVRVLLDLQLVPPSVETRLPRRGRVVLVQR